VRAISRLVRPRATSAATSRSRLDSRTGPGQELKAEAVAHQGRQLQHPTRGNAQPVKTPVENLADAPGQAGRLAGDHSQASLRPEQPDQLGGEERVPPGGIVEPGGEGRICRLPGDGGQVLREFRLVQPFQGGSTGPRARRPARRAP
jgi:hypothetical protein